MPLQLVFTFSKGDTVEVKGVRGVIDKIYDKHISIEKDGGGYLFLPLPVKGIKQIEAAKRCFTCEADIAEHFNFCVICGDNLNRTSSARIVAIK